jgi:soluble lytic murein transglycosylase
MAKKIAYLLISVILLAAFLLVAFPLRETAGLPDPPPQEPELAELLKKLKEGNALGDEVLLSLSGRKDAVGYTAILQLAERSEDPQALWRQALELLSRADVRMRLAQWLENSGNREEAVNQYLLLLPEPQALEALIRLDTDKAAILEGLIRGSHWQTLLDYLDSMEPEEREGYASAAAMALVNLGEYERALPVLAALAQSEPVVKEIYWPYARALEDAGETEKAMQYYRLAGPEGGRRLGRLYEQKGETEKAAAAYGRSTEVNALWRSAVLWEEAGERQRALALYRTLAGEAGPVQDDALFRGYLLLQRQDEEEAGIWLTQLSAMTAWMDRLGKEPVWPAWAEPGEGEEPDVLIRLEAYRQAEWEEMAVLELDIAWRHGSAEEKTALGQWYLNQDNYRQAVRWGSGALRDKPSRDAYLLAYPRPYRQWVEAAAAEFSLSPALLWAVMREESRFQPAVVSRVGALGLMQIMPATGKSIAAALETEPGGDELLSPEVNIRFGAYYLRDMLERFGNDLDMALAAYNAGPANARRWSRSALGQEPYGFPAAVGFAETREYITKVREGYLIYRWLYEY